MFTPTFSFLTSPGTSGRSCQPAFGSSSARRGPAGARVGRLLSALMKCIYSARLGPGPAHHREEWETCSLVCSAPRRSPGLPLPRGAGPGWSGRSSWGLQAEAPLLPGARAGWVPPSTASPSPHGAQLPSGRSAAWACPAPHPIVPAPPREVSGGMSRLCLPFLPFGFVGEGMCGVGATGKRWIMCLFFNSKKKPTSRIPVCSPWTWAFRLLPLTEEEAASGHGQPRSAPPCTLARSC